MALPYTIANGDIPNATILMANFNYLLAGGSAGTVASYTAHKTTALAAPTVPFSCIADGTDGLVKGWFLYNGLPSTGDGGFHLILGWE